MGEGSRIAGLALAKGAATALLLALLAASTADARARADVSDRPAGAAVLEFGAQGVIDRPGDRDWYAVDAAPEHADFWVDVRVSVMATNPTCPAAAPLLMSVHNRDGRWMTTKAAYAPNGEVTAADMALPSLGQRYLFEIVAAEPGCVGLSYEIGLAKIAGRSSSIGASQLCAIAKGQRRSAERKLRDIRRDLDGAKSPGARQFQRARLARQKREVAKARARERTACSLKR